MAISQTTAVSKIQLFSYLFSSKIVSCKWSEAEMSTAFPGHFQAKSVSSVISIKTRQQFLTVRSIKKHPSQSLSPTNSFWLNYLGLYTTLKMIVE